MWVILVAISVFGLSTYLTNGYAGKQIKTHYLQAFEKKYWAELDTFHAGSLAVTKNYFNRVFGNITRLATYEPAIDAVNTKNIPVLAAILDQQHDVTALVTSLFILDQNGIMIAQSSDNDTLKSQLGVSYAEQPYFKTVAETKKPSASKVFQTKRSGVAAINFCAPFLQDEQLKAMVCSGIGLEALATRLKAAELKSDFASFKAVVTDTEGSILFEDDQAPTKPVNIKEDRAVAALIGGAATYADEEIAFNNVETFVKATRVDLGSDGGVFVLSYLPKADAVRELNLLEATLSRINTGNGFRALLLTLMACAIIYWVIRKHDEETTNS